MSFTFLDLFAGAGGLSEGFIQAGYNPVSHVEIDESACYTLKTRMAYKWLKANDKVSIYKDYLNQVIDRDELYKNIPSSILDSVINKEINKDNLNDIFDKIDSARNGEDIDIIIGGPPCQAYSLVGRSRDKNKMKGDKRNYLFLYYAEFLKRYNPKYFVFENVLGLLSAKDDNEKRYLDQMISLFKKCGYSVEYNVLSAEEYGVLQQRKRIILVGKKGKHSNFYPYPEKEDNKTTVNEIFKDLPTLKAGRGSILPCKTKKYSGTWLYDSGVKNDILPVTFHQARPHNKQDLKIYKIAASLWESKKTRLKYNDLPENLKTHKNRSSFVDRFKVVSGSDKASHTIVAHISKDGHHYIHPDIKQNRSLTPREAARIQTFPDDYYFESISGKPSRTTAFKQIGNAVPVLLAKKIASKLLEIW